MIKISLLIIFVLSGISTLWADEGAGDDLAFIQQLDHIKNPFEDGLPKPVIEVKKKQNPRRKRSLHLHVVKPRALPRPKPVVIVPVKLPALKLKGVMVGDEMHQAIINDTVVSLQETINGARLVAVNKDGVELMYMGKKFFLKVE